MNPNQGSRRALCFIAACVLLVATAGEAHNVSVGVVLDMDSWIGKVGLSCIHMSLSEFYEANPHYNTRIVLHPNDSAGDVVAAAAAEHRSSIPVKSLSSSIIQYQEYVISIFKFLTKL